MLEIFLGKWIFSARVLDESSPADIVVAPSSCYFLFGDLCRFMDPELQMVSISHLLVIWDEGMCSFLDILNCQPNPHKYEELSGSSPSIPYGSSLVKKPIPRIFFWGLLDVIVIRYAASCPKWKKVRPKAVPRRSPKTHLRCLVPWNGRDVQGRWESLKPMGREFWSWSSLNKLMKAWYEAFGQLSAVQCCETMSDSWNHCSVKRFRIAKGGYFHSLDLVVCKPSLWHESKTSAEAKTP